MNERIRRASEIGWRAATTAFVVWSAAGCEPQQTPIATPTRPAVLGPASPTRSAIELAPKPITDREYVVSVINELQPSPIKDLLVSRIEPLLQIPTPKSIDIGGITIPVHALTVNLITAPGTETAGNALPRSQSIQNVPIYRMAEDTTISIPYLDLAKSGERDRFSGVSNETPFMTFKIDAGTQFAEGIWPEIKVTSPSNPANPAVVERIKKHTVLKEVSTLLLHLLYVEGVISEMNQSGSSPFIKAQLPDGSTRQAEGVDSSIDSIASAHGRLQASIDIGGYILAAKANAGTQVLNDIEGANKEFAQFHRDIERVSLGSTPEDIRKNVLTAAMTIPNVPHFYVGDLNKIP